MWYNNFNIKEDFQETGHLPRLFCPHLTVLDLYIKVDVSQANRVTAPITSGRKVRAPPGRTPGNTREGKPYGKRNRNIPPAALSKEGDEGKGEMVG